MKIVQNIDARELLVKRYWKKTRRLFAALRKPLIDQAEHTDGDRLKLMIADLLNPEPMKDHIDGLWGRVGGKFAYDTESRIKPPEKYESIRLELKTAKEKLKTWEERMTAYSAERSLQKTKSIMTTEQEAINKVIDEVLQQGLDEGLAIPEIRKRMVKNLSGDAITEIENWQAERIARTEVISAGNTGSFEAAQENKEGVKKEWSTSGYGSPRVRDSHLFYESLGPVEMDYNYNRSTSLQFPGDPDCTLAEEVINCMCAVQYNTGT